MEIKSVELNLSELKAYIDRPLIYVVSDEAQVLYVGKSSRGLTRIFDATHTHRRILWKEATSIEIFPCANDREMDSLEQSMIFKLAPKYNGTETYLHRKEGSREAALAYQKRYDKRKRELLSIVKFKGRVVDPNGS